MTFRFGCDTCGEVSTEKDVEEMRSDAGFKLIWDDLKKLGWRATCRLSEWTHYCPKCAKERQLL